MKSLILSLMLCMMMLFSFASATETLGTIKQNTCIEIPQVCASCSYVNLSVQYPNKSIAISNQAMTPNGAGLWTYNFCNTSQLGRYDVSGQGDLNGVDTGFSVLWFEVTTDGLSNQLSKLDNYYILFILIPLVLALILGGVALYTDKKLLIFSAMAFLTTGLVIANYPSGIENLFIIDVLSILNYGLAFLCLALGMYEWFPEDL